MGELQPHTIEEQALAAEVYPLFHGLDGSDEGKGRALDFIGRLFGTKRLKTDLAREFLSTYGTQREVDLDPDDKKRLYSDWPSEHRIALTPHVSGLQAGIWTHEGAMRFEARRILWEQVIQLKAALLDPNRVRRTERRESLEQDIRSYVEEFEAIYQRPILDEDLVSWVYYSPEDIGECTRLMSRILHRKMPK